MKSLQRPFSSAFQARKIKDIENVEYTVAGVYQIEKTSGKLYNKFHNDQFLIVPFEDSGQKYSGKFSLVSIGNDKFYFSSPVFDFGSELPLFVINEIKTNGLTDLLVIIIPKKKKLRLYLAKNLTDEEIMDVITNLSKDKYDDNINSLYGRLRPLTVTVNINLLSGINNDSLLAS